MLLYTLQGQMWIKRRLKRCWNLTSRHHCNLAEGFNYQPNEPESRGELLYINNKEVGCTTYCTILPRIFTCSISGLIWSKNKILEHFSISCIFVYRKSVMLQWLRKKLCQNITKELSSAPCQAKLLTATTELRLRSCVMWPRLVW